MSDTEIVETAYKLYCEKAPLAALYTKFGCGGEPCRAFFDLERTILEVSKIRSHEMDNPKVMGMHFILMEWLRSTDDLLNSLPEL